MNIEGSCYRAKGREKERERKEGREQRRERRKGRERAKLWYIKAVTCRHVYVYTKAFRLVTSTRG